jgi:pimeloyl-ACP methyl ester carboxylesterase
MIELPILDERSLLFLHGDDGPLAAEPFVTALRADMAPGGEIAAPVCPGWTGEPLPVWLRTVDQLAYHYLDALEGVATTPITAIGASFGAWLLLEIATKQPQLFSTLVLISPVGVKLTDRETAQFADLFARDIKARAAALYADPASAIASASLLDDDGLAAFATAQEAVARFGWEPYLHNPLLRHRLHRVTCPTAIIYGARDRFVEDIDYYDQLSQLLGAHKHLIAIAGAGQRVEQEQPVQLARAVSDFLNRSR